MEETVFTPRLKLTLVKSAERGSKELGWIHELRSCEKGTHWSIYGQSKCLEDTEKWVRNLFATPPSEDSENPASKSYCVVYAVHEIITTPTDPKDPTTAASHPSQDAKTRLIGSISLRSLGTRTGDLVLPAEHNPTDRLTSTTLSIELGYQFLPFSWGKGYASEAVSASLDACRRATQYWAPHDRLYVRAIVNAENPASLGVMRKVGMESMGTWNWTGDAVWLAGRWITESKICIWGKFLIE